MKNTQLIEAGTLIAKSKATYLNKLADTYADSMTQNKEVFAVVNAAPNPTKKCTKCEQELELSEFCKCRTSKDGLQYKCKTCAKAYQLDNKEHRKAYLENTREQRIAYSKKYYAEHKEEARIYSKKYNIEHREQNRQRCKIYNKKHRHELIEKQRIYNDAHKEESKIYSKKYYEKNRAEILAASLDYKQNNPEKAKAHRIVRTAIKAGTLIKQPCEVCGTTARIAAHHKDYTEPLEVNWLCQSHHQRLHEHINRINETEV